MMNILITNDDGVDASGIKALSEVASRFGKVTVVAPDSPRSGQSAALTVEIPVRLTLLSKTDTIDVYSCSGTPVDCVKLALFELFGDKKPDLLLSGINHGSNASINIHYSGTLGAVVEGAMKGIKSIGFSFLSHLPNADFSVAQEVVDKTLKRLVDYPFPKDTALNINIPNTQELKGIRFARQSRCLWTGEYDRRDRMGSPYYWLIGRMVNLEPNETDTDLWLLDNGYASIVPFTIDMTCYRFLDQLKEIELD